MTGLRTAALFFAIWLLLEFVAQGWLGWQMIQSGFQRELPKTVCSPITGRRLHRSDPARK